MAGSTWNTVGFGLQAYGTILSSIGSYYAAKSRINELKSQASFADYESQVANLNARQAELDAQFTIEAGQEEAARLGLQYGQVYSDNAASVGGRGIKAGDGSTAEVQASVRLAAALDRRSFDINTVRRANALRGESVDYSNRAIMQDINARNLRTSARSISPGRAAFTTLLGGASSIASRWIPSSGGA